MRLLLATRNRHKAVELSAMLGRSSLEIATLLDFPDLPETVEDQPTLEGNASKKALEAARGSGLCALADDTGLEVDALDGRPGVLSARFAGPACDFAANNAKLLEALGAAGEGDRRAVFRTVMALAGPDGRVSLEEGRLEGEIARRPRGGGGFGYDPLFVVAGTGRTLAELTLGEKNSLSHRRRALDAMLPRLRRLAQSSALALALAVPSLAGRTEPGQETIWDQIMAAQAHRGLRVGSRFMEEKRYDLAEKEFLRAILANPKDPQAHMMLGAAYYWNGKVDLSISEYRASLSLEPKNSQAIMLLGISLAWKGDNRAAYEAFKQAAEIDPARADLQMNLGSIEESLGLMTEALTHFRKAVALDPKAPLYHFQLGMLYRRLGRDAEAGERMRDALKLFPQFEDALLELGAADERRGDRKAAIHSFRKAVSLKSRDSVARFRLGRLYLQEGERTRAREAFSEAFHLTPEGEGGGLQLSLSYAGGKRQAPSAQEPPAGEMPPADPNDPLDVFARNLERVPPEQGAMLQVDVASIPRPKLVKADGAETPSALRSALEKAVSAPAGPAAKITRREFSIPPGNPHERAETIRKVISDLRKVMADAPPDADVRLGMNLTYTRLSSESAAGRGDSSEPPKVSYQPRQVGNDLGLWVMGTGWMNLVQEVLPDAGDPPSHPDDADWWVSTGLGYAALGDGERALASFERAHALEPGSELAMLGRGVGAVMTGNETGAIKAFQEVLRVNPKSRIARQGLEWLRKPVGGPNAKR